MTNTQFTIPAQANLDLTVFIEMGDDEHHCVFCSRMTKFRVYVSTDIGAMPPSAACAWCITELTV